MLLKDVNDIVGTIPCFTNWIISALSTRRRLSSGKGQLHKAPFGTQPASASVTGMFYGYQRSTHTFFFLSCGIFMDRKRSFDFESTVELVFRSLEGSRIVMVILAPAS